MKQIRDKRLWVGFLLMGLFLVIGCYHMEAERSYPPYRSPEEPSREPRRAYPPPPAPHTKVYRDPQVNQEYLLNPNWRRLERFGEHQDRGRMVSSFYDWSREVEVRIYEAISPQAQSQQSIGCQVEPDFVVVGGGAYVDYGTGSGAFLTESRPLDERLTTWVASSKDHYLPSPHTLYVYAIGLRLRDRSGRPVPPSELLRDIRIYSRTSDVRSHPRTESPIPPQSFLLGGGARVNTTGAGNLLFKSAPGPYGWVASSKDHVHPSPASVTAYTIFVPRRDRSPYFSRLEFSVVEREGPQVQNGVGTARGDVAPGWVLASVGGMDGSYRDTPPPYAGRLLFGIRPEGTYTTQISAYTKDHVVPQGGVTRVFFVQIRRER